MRLAQKVMEKAATRVPPLTEGPRKEHVKPEPTTARPADPPPPPRPEAKAVPAAGTRYPNGDVLCRVHDDRIDRCVCTVRSFRQPEKCRGCHFYRRG